jgi:hypothetical protein
MIYLVASLLKDSHIYTVNPHGDTCPLTIFKGIFFSKGGDPVAQCDRIDHQMIFVHQPGLNWLNVAPP